MLCSCCVVKAWRHKRCMFPPGSTIWAVHLSTKFSRASQECCALSRPYTGTATPRPLAGAHVVCNPMECSRVPARLDKAGAKSHFRTKPLPPSHSPSPSKAQEHIQPPWGPSSVFEESRAAHDVLGARTATQQTATVRGRCVCG